MRVFLSLGSNLGKKEQNIESAISLISKHCGIIIGKSNFIKTKAWGFESENDFVNNAIEIDTKLKPNELLSEILKIEKELGRKRKNIESYSDRIIDIDILFYDDKIIDNAELKIPHPLLHKRDFVLIPMNEIAPEFKHPVFNKTILILLNNLTNNNQRNIVLKQK